MGDLARRSLLAAAAATAAGWGAVPRVAAQAGAAPDAAASAAAPAAAPSAPAGRPLRPLNRATIAPVLERPIGEPIAAPTTSGSIELRGKRVYVAEYLLLVETGGEVLVPTKKGRLFGQRQGADQVALAYFTELDLAALQALVDRAWDDLQLRLKTAGVTLTPADEIVREHGAIYGASDEPSRPGKPVVVEHKSGESVRRYLALAPTGMKIVPRGLAGIGLGNPVARVTYPARNLEALSMALAVNTTGFDPGEERVSTFEGSDELAALSPLLEVGPAPSSALVHAHAQIGLVNLTEALVLAGEFGRLRLPPPTPQPIPSNDPLRMLGRTLDGVVSQVLGVPMRARGPVTGSGNDGNIAGTVAARRRLEVRLELDGPSLARQMLYGISAANQAIADTLRAAQLTFQQQWASPPPAAPASR